MSQNYHTLITGASSGIGKELAIECANRGMNVALVALDTPDLEQTAAYIRNEHRVDVQFLGINLIETGAAQQVYHWTRDLNLRINILINNAGIGNSGLFESNRLSEYLDIMNLNNRSMVELTYHFYQDLVSVEKGHILNVSSMEATLPLPYKAVYTGSKSFIYAFSLAIREELRNSKVSVTVLCPGPVLTNEEGYKRLQAHKNKGKFLSNLMVAYPKPVAQQTIKAMLRGRSVVIPRTLPWSIVKLMKFMPTGVKMSLLERIFRVYK